MVFAYVTESTGDCGNALQRIYTINVDPNNGDIKNDVLEFLQSFEPSPVLNLNTIEYNLDEQENQERKALTFSLTQSAQITFPELKERRQSFGHEVDVLTGYDMKEFNNKFVEMMKVKGWTLTQYFKDGNLPTREWTFYKGGNSATTEY